MAKRIELVFVERGVRATAELLEEDAPAVCAALWQALEVPLEAKVTHAVRSGQEVMLDLPPANRRFDPAGVPPQNVTVYPAPGDILWAYLPPYWLKGFREGLWDFIIVYGLSILSALQTGPLPSSHWARITSGLPEFAAECARASTEGQILLRVSRLQGD